ncbi:MAG: flagellar biosynthesis protein FlhB [Planctomycetes bacterium]|nr:flagellar biosynthesis protein FlhB [Planctomycetota bacterium]
MPDKPAAEKTEQPTPKRLTKAREKGQTPQSQELTSAVSILVLILILALMAPGMLKWFIAQLRQAMSCDTTAFANSAAFINFANTKMADLIILTCPIMAVLFLGSVFSGLAISGLNFAPKAISIKFSSINPISGLGKLVNARSMVKLTISIVKLFFVSIIVWLYLKSKIDTFATLRWAWSAQIIISISKMVFGLVIRVSIALIIIGITDAIYQKWKYIQELKMTLQEVKQERKETDGSPEVKARIRRIQIQAAMKRMLQDVPKANVIIVNPTHVAVAIRYDAKEMQAPIVVAKGADHLAEKIREIARAYGVPIIRKPELARTIYSSIKVGQIIPETLYMAVAEVLAMIHRLRNRK